MAPKRKPTEAAMPAKRQRKLPAAMEEYVCEKVQVVTKQTPTKATEEGKPPRSHAKKPVVASPAAAASPAPTSAPSSTAPTPVAPPRAGSRPKAASAASKALPSSAAAATKPSSSSSASSSSSSSSGSAPIDIFKLWAQVWKALVTVVTTTLVVFTGNAIVEVTYLGLKPPSPGALATKLGVVLAWVVAVVTLPFVAISIAVAFLNAFNHGKADVQFAAGAILAAAVASTAYYALRL